MVRKRSTKSMTPTHKERCERCKGTGWYQYRGFGGGTPPSKICEFCCSHEGGPWKADDGKYYCAKGCGEEVDHSQPSGEKREEPRCSKHDEARCPECILVAPANSE